MLIAVLNQSTLVSNENIRQCIKALNKQMTLHMAPAWNQLPPDIKFFDASASVPGYAWVLRIFDSVEVAKNSNYSYKMNGKVNGFVFVKPILDNGGSIFGQDGKISICSSLSHEICEMFVDRFASQWANGLVSEFGSQYACEVCDPVENDLYIIEIDVNTPSGYFKVVNGVPVKNPDNTLSCSVSNFVFPSWFNIEAREYNFPYDYLGILPASFKMNTGGSMIMRVSGSNTMNYVYAPDYPEWKKEVKNKFGRRNF